LSQLRRLAVVPVIALAIVILDQWTKGLIEANIPLWEGYAPFPALEPYFRLVHYPNTGVAFGMFPGSNSISILINLAIIAGIVYFAFNLPEKNWAILLFLGLMLGGAVGNLIDRIQLGHVTDFLLFSLPINGRVYSWPAFNVADSCVVIGTILLGIILIFQETKKDEGREPVA
jgi:signal peptidase II